MQNKSESYFLFRYFTLISPDSKKLQTALKFNNYGVIVLFFDLILASMPKANHQKIKATRAGNINQTVISLQS